MRPEPLESYKWSCSFDRIAAGFNFRLLLLVESKLFASDRAKKLTSPMEQRKSVGKKVRLSRNESTTDGKR